jgi:hypothetical protein
VRWKTIKYQHRWCLSKEEQVLDQKHAAILTVAVPIALLGGVTFVLFGIARGPLWAYLLTDFCIFTAFLLTVSEEKLELIFGEVYEEFEGVGRKVVLVISSAVFTFLSVGLALVWWI